MYLCAVPAYISTQKISDPEKLLKGALCNRQQSRVTIQSVNSQWHYVTVKTEFHSIRLLNNDNVYRVRTQHLGMTCFSLESTSADKAVVSVVHD